MIIHADMDAFFASVEERERPELAGRPLVVGGTVAQRGVVAAANYAARRFGIRSAMPTRDALRRCPDLVLLPPRMALYAEVSQQIRAIFERYTPLIEPLSLDEAFLDVSGSLRLFGSPAQIGRRIKEDVANELQLVVSVGVAPNKFLAKLASDLDKPDGYVLVDPKHIHEFLDPLPVSRIWGVGPQTEKVLHGLGIHTIAQLRVRDVDSLEQRLGQHGHHLWRLANGLDNREVVCEREAKSISHETTFAQDIADADTLYAILLDLTEQVAIRLRRAQHQGRTVHLKLRHGDFHTITRAKTLSEPTQNTQALWQTAKQLLATELRKGLPPLRLIGMGVSEFQEKGTPQLDLFAAEQAEHDELDEVADEINVRFGKSTLRRARAVKRTSS
jgi:DNA polymerase-4